MNRHRLLALFVLATVVACLIGLRHARMQSSTLRRITSTTEEGISLNPSISGDGRVIGFESTEDVAAAGGTDHFRAIRANITGDPATFFQIAGSRMVAPAISQDGARIAFASREDLLGTNSDGNSEIFLFDGAKLIQVTNTSPGSLANRITNGNSQPSISDDGRFIAFSSNRDLAGQNSDGNLEIFVYDANANSFAQLTNSSGTVGATDAKISGNGTAVAFIRDNGASPRTARDLMKQPRAGGAATVLASGVQSLAMTYGRAISDDGARVVYAAETATNTTQVFMFDGRSGGTIRQITSLGARVTEVPLHPTISGDGSRIAFAARRAVSGAASNSDGGVELYVFDFPTLTFAKITNAPSSATAEVVSSLNDDGSIVAFNFPRVLSGAVTNSGTENNSEIYAISPPARPANGTLTAILNDASFGHEPSSTKAIAPSSIAVAQGTNLANTTAQSQRLADGTFPTNVGGTRVTVNGRAAQIFFVSPTQVIFLVPPQTEIGTAEVVVTNSENFPSRGTVSNLRSAPGIFTKTGDGIGEGVIINADTLQEGPFDPTGGNLHLSIFATGARSAAATTVSIGGRVVNAEAVLPSTMPGLDEVHVRVPADLRGAGTVNLTVNSDGRDSNPVTVSFLGDPSRAIFFNEILSDPPNGIAGDANNDGTRDTTDDEFVEFVNGSSTETIGMSGWTVKTRATGSTTETTRFTFPAGTSLAPGTAAVIFGGGTFSPSDPIFGCAQIFKATSASSGLSLTNTGLTILLRDSAGNLIAQFSYGGSTGLDGNNSQSLTRSPDITGSFVLHTTANAARRFSPGLKVDGTPFGTCASHPATVTISPTSASVNQGQSTQFTAQVFDQFGRAMTGVPITFTSDNTTVATIDSTSTNPSNGVVTANVGTHNPGTAHITASATDGTTTANSTQATLTVVGPSLTVGDVSKFEGNAGATTFSFTVSLSLPAPSGGVRFDIATQDGTATVANNDYVARALTNQIIPAGAQTYSFDVTVNGDPGVEPNENFFVSVSNVSGASITKGQGTGTIVNDDSPTLTVSDVSANEGDSGTNKFTFTVTTPVVAGSSGITFDIATADGTASAASGDYVARALTSQTIPAGQSSYTFDVTVNGDTLVEANETFLVNITNVSGATVNDSQGQGTIQNDDTANLVISQVYPGGGLSSATYTNDFIELYNRGTATVDFSITPYSAQFLSTSGSTWAKTDLTTGVIGPGRYFLIREASGGATGAALPTPDATGTINLTSTTDGKVALVLGATLLAGSCPGDDGTAPFNPTNIADFVGYGGTAATANHCYEGTGPASFTLGNNTIAAFRKAGGCVDTNDNAADFFTAQTSPRNSSSPIGDCKPEITINDVTVTEGNSGTVNATFTVSLSAASAQTVKVDFATADGTAAAPSDYQTNSGTLTFNPGDLTKTITVLVNGDTMDEPNETFLVNLSNVVNAVILDSQGQGTINDNDAAPSVSINDVTVTEGNTGTTPATFTVTLSAASGFTVTANYASADNTATAGSDYQTTSGNVTFNPGETSKQISVLVNGDTDFEQNESFFVNLSGPVNASIADSQGIGTINNDDPLPPTPNFFVDDVNISEGDSGTRTANFTVTLNPAAGQQVTVQYATANGTATAGSDYQSTSGTLTFAPGETSKPVSVTINGDTLVEPDETFFVNLSSPSAGTNLGDPQGAGTIQNDDLALLVISQVYPGGGLSGATYANDFVELYNRASTTVDFSVTPYSIQFLSTGGSTWAKTDITTGTIAPGHYFLIKEASGGAVGAALPAADATGTINLTSTTAGKVALVTNTTLLNGNCPGDDNVQPFNPAGAPLADFAGYLGTAATANHCYEGSGPASFTSGSNTTADFRKKGGCTDTNDNTADFLTATPFPRNSSSTNDCAGGATPNLSINNASVAEGNSGTTTATFTLSLSTPAQGADVTFDIATADGTATTANSDYVAKSLTNQVIPAGQTTYTFTVNVNGDANVENDETFLVNVTNVVGANVTNSQGTGTIQNDDLPTVSINDVAVTEGNSGATNLDFTVSLSAPAPATVTFDIATADGTATTADSDYVTKSLTGQTIAAGQQTYHFLVAVNGDTTVETSETLFVNLSNVTGATVADGQGQGTILNDDSPTLSITQSVSVAEGNSGTTNATFTVTLSPTSNQTVTVQYATADGTAKSTSDYQSTSGTLTFDPGDSTKTIDVPVNGDLLVEANEAFTISLSNPSVNAAISAINGTGTGTIQNDDTALVVISQVYGGGGNSGATYKNDFIEVFNRGTTTVDLAGWSVQQASATGASWSVTPLCATSCLLVPGRYFLVQEASSAAIGLDLPTPDATGTSNLAATSGKIALVTNTTPLSGSGCPFASSVIDFVGFGTTADCFEGANHAAAPSATASDLRGMNGCADTNNNDADFTVGTPNPRNTASPLNDCNAPPTLTSVTISPASLTIGSGDATQFTGQAFDQFGQPIGSVTVSFASNNTTVATVDSVSPTSGTGSATGTITGHATGTAEIRASATNGSTNVTSSPATLTVEPAAGQVLISEFRTRGPASASDEFIEIYNPGTSSIVIGGLKIRASTSTGTPSDRVSIPANTILGPGCHYLVANNTAGTGYSGATSPDQTYTTAIADNGGIAITRSNDAVIDAVGMGASSAYQEGTILTPLAGSANQSYERKPGGASGNGTDTNSNASDFILNAATSNPQNSSSGCLNTATSDLSITNADSPDPVTVGSNLTYTITVTNNGIGTASNVVVTDNLPSSLTFVSCNSTGGGVCGGAGNNRTVNFSSLSVGASATITIVGTVNGTGGASISNTASVSSATTDPNNANDSALATTTVSSADLSITNSDSPDPVNAGENITYTLTVTNNSATIPAETVTVSDPLASNTTLVSVGATPAGWTRTDSTAVGATGTITYTKTTLAASGTATFTITVKVDSGAANNSTISNTASVSSNTPDDTPANNSAPAATTVRTPADLSVSKSVNDASPNVGDQITFTVTLSNGGPYAATGVLVKDVLPAGLTYVSDDGGGAYTSGTGIWNVGTVNASASATLHITASVTASAISGVTNTAEITASDQFDPDSTPNNHLGSEDDQASATVTAKSADLSLTKTVDNSSPTVSQNVTFTVTLNNGGPNAATNVVVKDALPAGLSYVSDDGGGAYVSGSGIWTVGTVNASASATLHITATVTSTGTITNTAEVTASDVFDPDSTPNNNNAGEDDQASRAISSLQADLSLTESVDNATPNVGSNVVFTIKLSNGGPDTATGVVVKDSLPAGLNFVSASSSQGTYNSSDGTWTVGSVSVGSDTATLSITATATSASINGVTNTAEVTACEVSDPDSTPNNHNAGEDDQKSVTVNAKDADLSVVKTVNNATPNVGSNVVFSIKLSNAGSDAANGVVVSDPLPAGLSFVSATTSQGTYNSSDGTWTVGAVSVGTDTATLSITATAATLGAKTNTAEITASQVFDPDSTPNNHNASEDDQSSVTVTPQQSADLSLTKSDSPDPVAIGNDITYTITITNAGPNAATSAVLSESVPTNTTFRSITPPVGWTCPTQPAVGGTGAISCTNASFGVGSSVFTIVVRVGAAVADNTVISNTASVSSSTSDPNPGSESATETTTAKTPLLVISQVYGAGGNVGATYTNDFIEIFNRGTTTVNFAASNYSLQYIGATGAFGGTTSSVKFDLISGSIAPGQYFLVQLAGGANGIALPTPDATGSITMAANAGKVALVRGTAALTAVTCPTDLTIADFVGYGATANCFEGAGPTPAPSTTNAAIRKGIAGTGCTDTNNNSADFNAAAVSPHNTASPTHSCP